MYRFAKRTFDIVCSLLGILVTSPFWLIAAVGIYLSDPGPVFYVANRVGQANTPFKMLKFRSMRQGKANEAVFRGDEDRIFPFGKFIRDTKIDELPQLINILTGSMSIVGPRPAAVDQMSVVRAGKYQIASQVAAGLTGPSALYDYIYGNTIVNEEAYERLVLPTRLDLDVYYVQNMSPVYDLKMIWYTVVCIAASLVGKVPQKIYAELLAAAKEVAAV